jgi:hypothetical protein
VVKELRDHLPPASAGKDSYTLLKFYSISTLLVSSVLKASLLMWHCLWQEAPAGCGHCSKMHCFASGSHLNATLLCTRAVLEFEKYT